MELRELGRATFDGAALVRDHPPRFTLGHKRRLYEGIPESIGGTLTVSRWTGELPATVDLSAGRAPTLEVARDQFTYPPDPPGATRWHANFADTHLFFAYGGSLMAQDEIQVMEHPVLGSLREALVAGTAGTPGLAPLARERGAPTPVLVRGAQRSMAIDTAQGLYGNAFARAPFDRIEAATRYLDPPTLSNIVAIVAPVGGSGRYSHDEIADILATASIGFGACRLESGDTTPMVHTGNWGTGAFGGNRVLMALLQLLAARIAGVERIVFHSREGDAHLREAQRVLNELPLTEAESTADLIDAVEARGFTWGVSDGN